MGNSAFFFPKNSPRRPSYITRGSAGLNTIRINRTNETFYFHLENGLITNALIEKSRGHQRISVQLALQNGKYKFQRVFITNQQLYFDETAPKAVLNSCSNGRNPAAPLKDIADKISSDTKQKFSVDPSCSSLLDGERFAELEKFLDLNSQPGKELQSCIADISKTQKSDEVKTRIQNIGSTIEGLANQKTQIGIKTINILCKDRPKDLPKEKLASTDAIGNMTFYSSGDGFLDLSKSKFNEIFLHELVHATHLPGCTEASEEKIAKAVAAKCSLDPVERDKLPTTDLVTESIGFGVVESASRETTAQISKTDDIKVAKAVEAIPPQKVSTQDLESVATIAQTTTPANSTFVNNAAESVFNKPMNAFSQAANKIAEVAIPTANASAAGIESVSSSASTSQISSSSRKSNGRGLASATIQAGLRQNEERLVEEIILPDSKNPSHLVKTTVVHDEVVAVPAAALLAKASDSASSPAADRRAPASVGGASASPSSSRAASTDVSGGNASSGFSENLKAAAKTQAASKPGSKAPATFASVEGIVFTASRISGASYENYKKKIGNITFKQSLERNGILITADGSLISKPSKVTVAYIDDGSSLVYANF